MEWVSVSQDRTVEVTTYLDLRDQGAIPVHPVPMALEVRKVNREETGWEAIPEFRDLQVTFS